MIVQAMPRLLIYVKIKSVSHFAGGATNPKVEVFLFCVLRQNQHVTDYSKDSRNRGGIVETLR